MSFVTQIDDVLPETYIDHILGEIKSNMVWHYMPDVAYGTGDGVGLWDKQMVAQILPTIASISHAEGNVAKFMLPVVFLLEDKFNVRVERIIRVKINMTYTVPETFDFKPWHIDNDTDGAKSILLYLNESDGGTTIINEAKTDADKNSDFSEYDNISNYEHVRVDFKQNRAVMFNSNLLHYGEFPKFHKNRLALNMIFVPK